MPSNDAETAIGRLQNRIPGSLYEVAWQYSIFDWYSSKQSDALDFDLNPEHLAYLTPSAKSSLFGEQDSLVVVYADLSDPQTPRLRSDEAGGPVEIKTYTQNDRFRVGHAYPEGKTSSMTDYSITTHKNADAHHIAGLRDDAWGTNNIRDRFTDWAQSEFAEGRYRLGHSHPDPNKLGAYVRPAQFPKMRPYLDDHAGIVLGHTHIQHEATIDGRLIVNPGSVGQPRDHDKRAAYVVLDTVADDVELRRVEYDINRVITRVEESKLPTKTGTRLLNGS